MIDLDTRSLASATFARRNFGCDSCGVAPGLKCVNALGKPMPTVHNARIHAARPTWLPLFEASRSTSNSDIAERPQRHEVFEVGSIRIGGARFPRVRCSCGVEAIATRGLVAWTSMHLDDQ